MASFLDRLKAFDAHGKLNDEYRVQTVTGAGVTVCAILIVVSMFISQVVWYFSVEKIETMAVDELQNVRLRINFDVSFPSTPCAAVSVGATDSSKAPHIDIMSHVTKRRLDDKGQPVGAGAVSTLGSTVTDSDALHAGRREAIDKGEATRLHGDGHGQVKEDGADAGNKCGSCYGSGSEGECCNTCESVRVLYRKKGWSFDPSGVEQCQQAGFIADLQATGHEGCTLVGYVEVPKVKGEIHFAPSASFALAHTHVRDLSDFAFSHFNNTHTWNVLSFGPVVPGKSDPLAGHTEVLPEGTRGAHQYYLKIVPTVFTDLRGRVTTSNQYSVTQHFKHLDASSGAGLPGIFINYDFSPLKVSIAEASRSTGHFLTSLCAIVGGTLTIMGMLDKGLHTAAAWWAARKAARFMSAGPKGLL